MKRVVIVFAILLAASLATAEDKFVSQGLGFELSVPEAPVSAAVYQVCLFYLPPTDGFSSNVNVQIQEYAGSLQDYKALSDKQFQQVGIEVKSSEIKDGILAIDYVGKMQTYQMHWYAKALKKGSRIYIITATSLDAHWKTDGPILMKSVQSFKLR